MSYSFSESEKLFERSKKIAPGGVHSPVRSFKGLGHSPVFFQKAEGARLYSVEGHSFIDFCQSFGPLILGHRDPDVQAAVEVMVKKAWSFGACEPYSLELAEWIVSRVKAVEKLRFVSSGTEAVMSALRVARGVTGRSKVLKFEGCYHGHVDSLLVKAGSGLAGESAASSAGISEATAHETLVVPLGRLDLFEEVLAREGNQIAAVIIEPLPANFGLLIQNEEYLKQVEKKTKACGALFILDEVISGFRIGLGGMAEKHGLDPDLVTYGKILGGGFPVGCYGGKAHHMSAVAPEGAVYQAGTLSANPIGMVAGLATLKKMESADGWNLLEQCGSRFEAKLAELIHEKDLPFEIVRMQSIFWLKPREGIPLSETFKKLFISALYEGVYFAPNAYEVGFLSLAHTDEILDEAIDRLRAAWA